MPGWGCTIACALGDGDQGDDENTVVEASSENELVSNDDVQKAICGGFCHVIVCTNFFVSFCVTLISRRC